MSSHIRAVAYLWLLNRNRLTLQTDCPTTSNSLRGAIIDSYNIPAIMTTAGSEYCHDHVILLLSSPDFEDPPAWLSDNFRIIEGGTHAGNLTPTRLIPVHRKCHCEASMSLCTCCIERASQLITAISRRLIPQQADYIR